MHRFQGCRASLESLCINFRGELSIIATLMFAVLLNDLVRSLIFHWVYSIWYVLQFSFEFSWFYTLNEFEFFNKFVLSIHLMYTIFPWVFTVLYIQWIQILNKFIRSVHLTYILFHWIFIISYFQWSQISQQI